MSSLSTSLPCISLIPLFNDDLHVSSHVSSRVLCWGPGCNGDNVKSIIKAARINDGGGAFLYDQDYSDSEEEVVEEGDDDDDDNNNNDN
eukprot:CAMPEP_0182460652 /NCGR_PEP_ID=MMETSP1319-20130603/5462_1 /TAXON_ID=172717 /ORGANISM="Bolidomonas pacifica, Strain RCC208" /LENGTH=88 /DNA_ID=CAMNT_0024659789 /DNA_START=173 /DNA_END=436 /DNA_ORIENTATION=+